MDTLPADVLVSIFSHLTDLNDLASASRVCRRWCPNLWSEGAQHTLWFPRIVSAIQNNLVIRHRSMHRVLQDEFLRHSIPYKDVESVLQYFRSGGEFERKVNQEYEALARGLCFGRHLLNWYIKSLMLSVSDDTESYKQVKAATFIVPKPTRELIEDENHCIVRINLHDFNQRSTLQVFVGSYALSPFAPDNLILKNAAAIINGELVYEGDFVGGTPNGHGKLYYKDMVAYEGGIAQCTASGYGTQYDPRPGKPKRICYQGHHRHGKRHGEGTSYHEIEPYSIQRMFDGQWENGDPIQGMWYDQDGSVVHVGFTADLLKQIDLLQYQHRCTFAATKHCYVTQHWYKCKTCSPEDSNQGVCISCAKRCHQGHKLEEQPKPSQFFCDCGTGDLPVTCLAIAEGCDDTTSCGCNSVEAEDKKPSPQSESSENTDTLIVSSDEDNEDEDEDAEGNSGDDDAEQQPPVPREVFINAQGQAFVEIAPDIFQRLNNIDIAALQQLLGALPDNEDNNTDDE